MDFLTLFAIYVAVVLTCIILICKYSGREHSPLNSLLNILSKVFAPITPKWLQQFCQRALHRLFHKRNNVLIYLQFLLVGAVYAEFTYEVLGFCKEMGSSLTSLSVPYVLLAFETLFFYLCVKRDPGTVTEKTTSSQLYMYPYDNRLFHPYTHCPTCNLIKPARSKHCRVCERCVQRFDHHCVWMNTCIGAYNTRYFLLYLFCLCAMAADIAFLTGTMLLEVVLQSGLFWAKYIDEHGQQQPAGPQFVIQHLFLTFPRIVFMLGFVVFIFLLLGGYTLFNFFLALVNQTSYEWYRSRSHSCEHCYPTLKADELNVATAHSKRFYYSRGLLRNLGEIFFPQRPVGKKDR
nr:palmitoyltransferase ZDHHC4-like [Nerophis lumbriciformis]